jgi:signal peptidase I
MGKFDSPFYPPRARWYGRLWQSAETLKRRLGMERLHRPSLTSTHDFVAGLVVPGWAFYLQGRRLVGKAIMGGYLLAALVFIIWLGYPFANLISGLMVGAHVTSILFLLRRQLAGLHWGMRLLIPLGIMFAVTQLVYLPMLGLVQNHLFLPLRVHGQVFVVQRQTSSRSIHRGDAIAYRLEEFRFEMYRVEEGFGLDRVIGLPGDTIQFLPDRFTVNGVPYGLYPNMPKAGEWVVPEKHWFVWPNFAITGHGATDGAYVSELIRANGMVDQTRFVGRAYAHWFGRRQSIP